ncbi:MAG: pyruvate formate lyase family protein [Eubacteriales bacterium]|nr:pyruvate formate lyase family protein [Eubacteriales bacterium]
MDNLSCLQAEIAQLPQDTTRLTTYYLALGFVQHFDDPVPLARAYAFASLLTGHRKVIYTHDRIAGSIRGCMRGDLPISDAALTWANGIVTSYGANSFLTNADHFAPDYETFLAEGVAGTLARIRSSKRQHQEDPDAVKKQPFLDAAEIAMLSFGTMVGQYGDAAAALAAQVSDPIHKTHLSEIARACRKLSTDKPDTFQEAIQLVWLAHIAFLYEGRYAMALGRLDQFLYPFYVRDITRGLLNREEALELVACTLCKIGERRIWGSDVVNIAIGGLRRDGTGGVNALSYIVLEAVRRCNIPGPNLSARLYDGVPDAFLDACLEVIGTGLGYPALMNDAVNIPALRRHGYALEDCRDYCFVGCIENFIPGKQPPWSDGRYNSPKYLELAMNNGVCMLTGVQMGPATGDAASFCSMADFMAALKAQMAYGAAEYMARFLNENDRHNRTRYTQPFLSCFCQDCIGRGRDINDGGAVYPSVHGAGCMGIANVADSLAAIETVIFQGEAVSLATLRDALRANFAGYEALRAKLLHAPKYGNNLDAVDRYAVWFVAVHDEIFSRYRTPDGGPIYTAIASNVSNIPAGKEIAATPDGRRSGQPVSDAASPSHGMDKNGPTAVMQSLAKPDYTRVSCGTVLNQKYSPALFSDPGKRAKLLALIKVYFQKGGQELQINAVSRELLADAMDNPEKYRDLVVRVSGFSAYFTQLDPRVQMDILERTEHG